MLMEFLRYNVLSIWCFVLTWAHLVGGVLTDSVVTGWW